MAQPAVGREPRVREWFRSAAVFAEIEAPAETQPAESGPARAAYRRLSVNRGARSMERLPGRTPTTRGLYQLAPLVRQLPDRAPPRPGWVSRCILICTAPASGPRSLHLRSRGDTAPEFISIAFTVFRDLSLSCAVYWKRRPPIHSLATNARWRAGEGLR